MVVYSEKETGVETKHLLMLPAIGLVILALSVIAAYSQGDIPFVKDSAFENPRRPPVAFYHDEHNEKAGLLECNGCHHVYENGKKLESSASVGMECSQCHLASENNSTIDLIRVYHLQCRGCHLKKNAGPILCGQCHQKNDN